MKRPSTKDHTCTAKVDIRTLATLAVIFEEEKTRISNKSQLIRTSLERYAYLLVKTKEKSFVTTKKEAYEIMQNLGYIKGIDQDMKLDLESELLETAQSISPDMLEQARKALIDFNNGGISMG